jgi:hypothetical protein
MPQSQGPDVLGQGKLMAASKVLSLSRDNVHTKRNLANGDNLAAKQCLKTFLLEMPVIGENIG